MTKVVVNGSFDVFHLGHLRLLEYAKSWPNAYVLVLTDTDRRIRELKGPTRPVNTAYERASLLAALKCVDRVEIFDTDEDLINYIKDFQPDIMIKGSDWQGGRIIGGEHAKRIIFYDRLGTYSSTNKIKDIANR